MNTRQRIVFFGSGEYTIPVINMLSRHGLMLVMTTETDGAVVEFLKQNHIPFLSTHVTDDKNISKKELWEKVEELQPTLGILASFGAIIPQSVINLFPHGIWNIHPSLLPKYKGPSPIQTTLLAGDTQTGVTIIKLDDQIDHGPILKQESVPLTGKETLVQLKCDLFKQGGEIIEELLDSLEHGHQVQERPQDHSQETFTEKITRESGFVDSTKPLKRDTIDRMIRAYYPWPGVWTKTVLFGKEKIIKLLPEGKIQVEGKRVMTYKEFINGYQKEGEKILEQLGLS